MYCRTLSAAVLGLVVIGGVHLTAQAVQPSPQGAGRVSKSVSAEARLDALSRAHVWKAPDVPVSEVRMAGHPAPPPFISCKFKISELGGTAPKFDCVLDNGDEIRVKYGRTPEIPSEVAAARLLRSLGFGADEVMLVPRLRCHGCPAMPFITMKAVDLTETDACLREGRRLQHAQRLRVGGGRAEARRPADRDRPGQGLGLLRARSGRRAQRAARRARTSMPCA